MSTAPINQNFPELETERLILRQITLDDTEALFRHWSDDEVTKYMNIESFQSPKQAEDMIKLLNELFEQKEAIRWGIVKKEDNRLIGTCGYNSWLKEQAFRGEIGYELGRAYWRQGFMQEALRAIISYGFEAMDLNRIEALVMLEACRSMNLLLKLGFQKEGILREHGYWKGQFWDEYCLSLLKRDWLKSKLSQNFVSS
jgi:[ribosomal protein S5]-alanine N-acetyltransferase